jgi:hypothetical protein
MSDLWTGVLIGAVIAIPIGIGVNLATPKLQKRLDRRSQRAADKAALRDAELLKQATEYADDYGSFQTYLLERVLFGIFALAGMILSAGCVVLMFVITQVPTSSNQPPSETVLAVNKVLDGTLNVLILVVLAISYILGITVLNRVSNAAVMMRMVKDVKSKRSEAEAPGIVADASTETTP